MAVDLTRDMVIRWEAPEPSHAALLRQAGVKAVLPSSANAAFSEACASVGIAVIAPGEIEFRKLSELGAPGAQVALAQGLWPGIRRPPAVEGRGDETASASREPWVDSNGSWIAYLRALYPERAPVLGYLPDGLGDRIVPYDTLELALVEAWSAGGNYVLAVEQTFREALLRKDPKALSAWEQLGRTARWLGENQALFRQVALPIVTALVEPGAATGEIVNLLYRRNVSPSVISAESLGPPDPRRVLALVAANLRQPEPAVASRILAHARAGTTVIAAAPASRRWWRSAPLRSTRTEEDRDVYALGRGQVVAYRGAIADPSEFALDVIDLIGHKERAVRLWNAPAVIALATDAPRAGGRLVHLVNYGSPIDQEIQVRVQGHFNRATLLRPDGSPLSLETALRGSTTEVFVPELTRLGVLAFQ